MLPRFNSIGLLWLLWPLSHVRSDSCTASGRPFHNQRTVTRCNFRDRHLPGNPSLDPRVKPAVLLNGMSGLMRTLKRTLRCASSDFR
jgi:hypothetical protein